MDFNLFIYCTVGRRHELEAGRAGLRNDLYQRMLAEIAELARAADEWGYDGFGHPEHHLQIEGFEMANDPNIMSMWLGRHTERLRVITCGFVSTTHNPLRVAENIATLDHVHQGRFGVGLVRGYQHRWVENYKIRPELAAVGPWNKNTPADDLNREYFAEFVDIVLTALREPLFDYQGRFWQFPPPGFTNPHPQPTYTRYGAGVDDDMRISQVGIAPRPYQDPHPPIYGGFGASMRTALFWARHRGKPIIMSSNYDFCSALWNGYREESRRHGHDVARGDEAAWGGIMICAPTDDEAQRQFEDMRWFWETWSIPFGNPMPELLVGSPDTISAKIEEASAVFAPTETFLLVPQGLQEPGQVLASLELFADKVLPRFSDTATP